MQAEILLKKEVSKAIQSLFGNGNLLPENFADAIKIEPTNPIFEGDLTVLIFPFVRYSKLSPEQTAEAIGKQIITQNAAFESFNVVKGFLNISFTHQFWLNWFATLNIETHGKAVKKPAETIVVEYSSPNTNKPLHLGHVRNIILGHSVSTLLSYYGFEVKKVNLINDRGIHICKSMLAYQKLGNNETPESSGLKGDHLIGKYYVAFDKLYKQEIEALMAKGMDEETAKKQAPSMLEAQNMLQKWEDGDAATIALWKKLNDWVYSGFEVSYKNLGVTFDKFYYESNTYLLGKAMVEEGLQNQLFYKKEDGSVWIDLEAEKLDQKLLLRKDGTSVYITQDMGTADLKYKEFGADKSIIVVGNEQDYHFKVLFSILQKMNRPYAAGNFHLSYGMVDLPSGKMKSREGTVVDADDLMAEMIAGAKAKTDALGKTDGMEDAELNNLHRVIGMAALKYFILKVDPSKRMLFNPEESIDLQGDTGPFIQYSYTRIQSILRQYPNQDLSIDAQLALHEAELGLIKQIAYFEEVMERAVANYSPALIANYTYDLAKSFNKLYAEVSFLKEPNEQLKMNRIALCKATAYLLKTGLFILGIEVPERM